MIKKIICLMLMIAALSLGLAVRSGDAQVVETIIVAIDIEPRHCPNKIKLDADETDELKVVILGTEDLDVRDIDICSLFL